MAVIADASNLNARIYADSISFQPQVVQSSIRGLVTPSALSPTAKPLSLDKIHELIRLYGPILKLHPDEQYFNSSVEDFLSHCTLVDKKTNKRVPKPAINSLPQKGEDGQFYLELDADGKAGNFATAKAYVRAFWNPGLAYTELQFWFFSPYNGPGMVHVNGLVMDSITSSGDVPLKPLGEHYGDWELCVIRVDNTSTQITSIWLSQHSKGQYFTGDQLDREFTFQGKQPIIYSSLYGHANYSRVGSNPSEYRKIGGIPAGLDFFIRNDTAAGGKSLDCSKKYELISADWLQLAPPKWVTYPFRWGPEGTTVQLKPSTVVELVRAAAGEELATFLPVGVLTIVVAEILPHFIKRDINGAEAPIKHGSWMGTYPAF